jgi:hypothetical protein
MWDQTGIGRLQLSSTYDTAPPSAGVAHLAAEASSEPALGTPFWYTSVDPNLLMATSTVEVEDSLKNTAEAEGGHRPVKSVHLPKRGGSHAIYTVSSVRNDDSTVRHGPNPFAGMATQQIRLPCSSAVSQEDALLPLGAALDPLAVERLRCDCFHDWRDLGRALGTSTRPLGSCTSSVVDHRPDVLAAQPGQQPWGLDAQQQQQQLQQQKAFKTLLPQEAVTQLDQPPLTGDPSDPICDASRLTRCPFDLLQAHMSCLTCSVHCMSFLFV